MAFFWSTLIVAILLSIGTSQADQKAGNKQTAFLERTARKQLAEVALGRLAVKKASDNKVKDFAAEIIEDHLYVSQEIKQLSATEGFYLPVELDDQQKKEQRRLTRLSGNEFDKAFIAYLLKQHRKDVEDLRKTAAKLQNELVKQWIEAAEPILAVHLKKAEYVAQALGVEEGK